VTWVISLAWQKTPISRDRQVTGDFLLSSGFWLQTSPFGLPTSKFVIQYSIFDILLLSSRAPAAYVHNRTASGRTGLHELPQISWILVTVVTGDFLLASVFWLLASVFGLLTL
jgi:hypothetical protein